MSAYSQGWLAAEHQQSEAWCPYVKGTDKANEWMQGYRDAIDFWYS